MIKTLKKHLPLIRILCILLIIIILYCRAFIHYDKETDKNTYNVTATIHNVEFVPCYRVYYVRFSTQYGEYYYKFLDNNPREGVKILKNIEQNRIIVSLTITEEKEPWRHLLYFNGCSQVVEIRDDEQVYFPIDEYNANQLFYKITYSVMASVGLFIVIAYCYIMKKLK